MSTPQSLRSSSVNPANLLELQVLTQVVSQLQHNDDIKGSIPYLAKIVQIIENQQLPTGSDTFNCRQQRDQLLELKADANAQLADAYFKTQQFVLCEVNLLTSVKIWEKLLVQHPDVKSLLQTGYQQLKEAYEAMGKTQLAQHMETKLARILSQ